MGRKVTTFGIMMPRGTTKLKLSKMNMGGTGAKMIRTIMKKGISSPEELIDGVESGGAATFIGSGEESDVSLFI